MSTDLPAKTPPSKEPFVEKTSRRAPARQRPSAGDPLEAQGRAFWAAQRFDAPARAVYMHLADGTEVFGGEYNFTELSDGLLQLDDIWDTPRARHINVLGPGPAEVVVHLPGGISQIFEFEVTPT